MDRMSRLPDDVICHILSFLPTKHAVATSVLSSRWVNLWTFVPVIGIDDSLYLNPSRKRSNSELFIRFLDRVLSQNQSRTIVKFRLQLHDSYVQSLSGMNGFIQNDRVYLNPSGKDSSSELFIRFIERGLSLNQSQTIAKFHLYMHDCCEQTLSRINGFIQSVFLKNVVEVDLEILFRFPDDGYRLKIPHSESLKVLKVRTHYCITVPAFPGCFPSLGVVDLDVSVDEGDEWITNLFPCLPALEKLCLVGDLDERTEVYKFNIGGPFLKHLELDLKIYNYYGSDVVVVIDTPKLDYLRLRDGFIASYLVKNKPAISEVRLHVGVHDVEIFEVLEGIRHAIKLFQGLVNTKFMSVSASTLRVVSSRRWNLPVFPYVTKLEVEVPAGSWILLLHWLELCPNLKALSLIIKEEFVEEFEEVVPDMVPSCLSSYVKEIEIKRPGKVNEEEMVKYLLDNAKVLEKFTVDSQSQMAE